MLAMPLNTLDPRSGVDCLPLEGSTSPRRRHHCYLDPPRTPKYFCFAVLVILFLQDGLLLLDTFLGSCRDRPGDDFEFPPLPGRLTIRPPRFGPYILEVLGGLAEGAVTLPGPTGRGGTEEESTRMIQSWALKHRL